MAIAPKTLGISLKRAIKGSYVNEVTFGRPSGWGLVTKGANQD